MDTTAKIREAAKGLLEEGKAQFVLGYEKGSLPLSTRPCLIEKPEDTDRLVWDSLCSINLAVYLPRYFQVDLFKKRKGIEPPKIAVVAKACDIRSIVSLLKEHQVVRDHLTIIGVPCQGMVDTGDLDKQLPDEDIVKAEEDGSGSLRVTMASGIEKSFARNDLLAESCRECDRAAPEGADITIEGTAKSVSGTRYSRVKEFEAKTAQERWDIFTQEMSKCIRCYACRQACPNCFCKSCFAEQLKPKWVGAGTELQEIAMYHIGRIYHQAGRCVACDACARACPAGVDLSLFTRKIVKDVEEMFGFVPEAAADEPLPLWTYQEGDSQDFVIES